MSWSKRSVKILMGGVLIAIACTLSLSKCYAKELSGKDILKKMMDIGNRSIDSIAKARMILTHKDGSKIERVIESFRLNLKNGSSKSLIAFRSPADIKGTALLVWSYKDKDDEQWLYLPAYNRIRKIASSGKGESFAGSDFSYGDMEEQDLKDFTYTRLDNTKEKSYTCYVVEAKPKKDTHQYSKYIYYVDQETFLPAKIEFYGWYKKDKPIKIAFCDEFRDIKGIPTIFSLEMHNIGKNHKTKLLMDEVKYDTGLKESFFTKRYLKRGGM